MAPRRRPLLGLMVLALILVSTPFAQASAQTGGALELVGQTTWVEPEGAFQLEIRAPGAPDSATIGLTIRNRITSRIAFSRGLDDLEFRPAIHRVAPKPLRDLTSASGSVSIRIDVTAEAVRGDDGRIISVPETNQAGDVTQEVTVDDRVSLTEPGVYPVVLELRSADGELLDTLVTHLLRDYEPNESAGEHPLLVALHLRIDAPVARRPNGAVGLEDAALDRARVLAETLGAQPNVPATLSIRPEFLDALEATGSDDLLGLLRSAVEGRELLAQPYVSLDASTWIRAGLVSQLSQQLSVGRQTTSEILGVEPTLSAWRAQPSTGPSTLTQLAALGAESFIFAESQLSAIGASEFPLTLTQPFHVVDGNSVARDGLQIDPELSAAFSRSANPVLDAHLLMADLFVLQLDQPGIARGVILEPPSDWTPAPLFLSILLDGLNTAASLEAATLSTLTTTLEAASSGGQLAPNDATLERQILMTGTTDLGNYPGEITRIAGDIVTFRSLLPPATPAEPDLTQLLLVSGDASLSDAEQTAYLEAITDFISRSTDGIEVTAPARVTLANRTADIPLTITNDLGFPVNVRLDFASDKLEFPDADSIEQTLRAGVNRVNITVRARASGDSAIAVRVLSPDRSLELGGTDFTVRSTALSGVGVVIAAISLLVLSVWWLRNFRSRRRSTDLVPA